MNSLLHNGMIQELFNTIAKAFTSDDKKEKGILKFVGVLLVFIVIIAISLISLEENKLLNNILTSALLFLSIIVISFLLVLSKIQNEKEKSKVEEKIVNAEKILENNPKEANASWNVAKLKIENYIDKNIYQINSIYNVSVSIIIIGFLVIAAGIIAIFLGKNNNVSIIVILSGVIINFIGGTILILQRNVFMLSKEYLTALERINAVGMCVQIVDLIENKEETNMKDEAISNIAKQVLTMYSNDNKSI